MTTGITQRLSLANLSPVAHGRALAKASRTATREQARLRRLARQERANPRSGSSIGHVIGISLTITFGALIIYSQPQFNFGIPNFEQEIRNSIDEVAVTYFTEYSRALNAIIEGVLENFLANLAVQIAGNLSATLG